MRFVYADNIRLHDRDGLQHLLQQRISFSSAFIGPSLPLFGLSLPFFELSLPVIHQVHVLVYYPSHCHLHLRETFQAANSIFHLELRLCYRFPLGLDCTISPNGGQACM